MPFQSQVPLNVEQHSLRVLWNSGVFYRSWDFYCSVVSGASAVLSGSSRIANIVQRCRMYNFRFIVFVYYLGGRRVLKALWGFVQFLVKAQRGQHNRLCYPIARECTKRLFENVYRLSVGARLGPSWQKLTIPTCDNRSGRMAGWVGSTTMAFQIFPTRRNSWNWIERFWLCF